MIEINRISQLTDAETIELRVTLEAMGERAYQCDRCLSQYRGKKNEGELLDATLKAKWCRGLSEKPVHRLSDSLGELRFRRCPGNFVSPGAVSLVTAHDAFEKGIPYCNGGILDQPTKVMEAFQIIGLWKADRQKKAHEQAMKQSSKGVRR